MILPDSSAWIEYDRATGSPTHLRLRELITNDGPLLVSEPVIMEVCAGARTLSRERQLRSLMDRFELAQLDPTHDCMTATAIYRSCREVGVTPRGLLDCLIAAVALRYSATLLSHDRDMRQIAEVIGIDLDAASA